MFWKVTGFSQPSPIEVWQCCAKDVLRGYSSLLTAVATRPTTQQILDKEEFTLEELLEEDDIVQECKSLNGRLVAL